MDPRRKRFDDLLCQMGEEETIGQFEQMEENHRFSAEYERNKERLLSRVGNSSEPLERGTYKRKGGRMKRFAILAACLVFVLGMSVTVYAAVKYFSVRGEKEEVTGEYTYNFTADGSQKVSKIRIIPEYLPEGFEETEEGSGKYAPGGEIGANGITISSANQYKDYKIPYVSQVEDTQFNGVKAQLLTREGIEYNHIIYLFYEEDGQVIEIFGHESVPLDELKKVAENIRYEESEEDEKVMAFEGTNTEITVEEPDITDQNMFTLGQETEDYSNGRIPDMTMPLFTVDSMEILDKAPELDQNNFRDYQEYQQWVNGDGTLKDYDRESTEWKDNQMITHTEKVSQKYVYVTLRMKNPTDKPLKSISVYPRMVCLNKQEDGTYAYDPKMETGGCVLQMDRAPFYFDQSDYSGKEFYYCDFKPGEEKVIHLCYAIDEDLIENSYIDFNLAGYTEEGVITSKYIKITK